MAWSVNFVWNYINELSERAIREYNHFLSGYDIHAYTKGAAQELGLNSGTVHGQVYYYGHYFKVWDSYGLSQYKFRSGSFNEDARGRWYFNIVVDVPEPELSTQTEAVGIDLGLKDVATCSDGQHLKNNRFYRDMEEKLAKAQRANKKKRVRGIHAKIKNRRKDAAHKFSRRVVDNYGAVYVGDVKSSKLAKTRIAKSVYDAGWSQLKTMLEYKCDHAGKVFKEVGEAYTTQACSHCGALPRSSPKGMNGLGMRQWVCSACGVTHDRDINAAKNIAALGHERPVEGIPSLKRREDVNPSGKALSF